MHKKLSILLKVLVGLLFVLACKKETSLLSNDQRLTSLHDSIPVDSIPIDSIPCDTIPNDTVPVPPNPYYEDSITGLIITPEIGDDDSTIIFTVKTKNTYPDENPYLVIYPQTGDSSLYIPVQMAVKVTPSATVSHPATAVFAYLPPINGDRPLKISFPGSPMLQGSITVTNTQYIFNWDHD